MWKRKKNHYCLPTIADMAANDDDEIVEQTKHVKKEGEKKETGESHACEQTREEVWLNRIFSFFFHFSI